MDKLPNTKIALYDFTLITGKKIYAGDTVHTGIIISDNGEDIELVFYHDDEINKIYIIVGYDNLRNINIIRRIQNNPLFV